MTRDEARTTIWIGCFGLYMAVVFAAAVSGSDTLLIIAVVPVLVAVVLLILGLFGYWVRAVYLYATGQTKED